MKHLLYLAIGFPPAAKSCATRMRETANLFSEYGWRVTVVTIDRSSWLREFGLDTTLEDRLSPGISVIELPLARYDLEPDIRQYGFLRARYPLWWQRQHRRYIDPISFPEPVFGAWRWSLTGHILRIFREQPADLILVSPAPYTLLAPTWRLSKRFGVPIAVDYRDAWSLDVIKGKAAFSAMSRRGRWERRILAKAVAIWCVNDSIREFYERRYPELAANMRTVPNGFDPEIVRLEPRIPDCGQGLKFGYVGTLNISSEHLDALIDGWRLARERNELVAKSQLIFRGHVSVSRNRTHSTRLDRLTSAADLGVSYEGPAAKSDIAKVYGEYDVLVLALAGGRYVTSGKVYEYVATGLPVMSVHDLDQGAVSVLRGYPLWVPPLGLEPGQIATSFVAAAQVAVSADGPARRAAAEYAEKFSRRRALEPAVRQLIDKVSPLTANAGSKQLMRTK